MGYLVTQIIICLLIAALIGFIIGWLLRGLGCNEQQEVYQEAGSVSSDASIINTLSSERTTADNKSTIDSLYSAGALGGTGAASTVSEVVSKVEAKYHKIEKIEGIGKSIANHLRNLGIKTTGDLIEKCSTDSGFQQVVKADDVTDSEVNFWLRMSDLMRVPDVDGQFAELMDACGIKSMQELAQADENALTTEMQIVNKRERKIPDSILLANVSMVEKWIGNAKAIQLRAEFYGRKR